MTEQEGITILGPPALRKLVQRVFALRRQRAAPSAVPEPSQMLSLQQVSPQSHG